MDFSKKNGKWTWKNLPYATIIEKYIWPGIKAVGKLILYGIAAIIHFIIWAIEESEGAVIFIAFLIFALISMVKCVGKEEDFKDNNAIQVIGEIHALPDTVVGFDLENHTFLPGDSNKTVSMLIKYPGLVNKMLIESIPLGNIKFYDKPGQHSLIVNSRDYAYEIYKDSVSARNNAVKNINSGKFKAHGWDNYEIWMPIKDVPRYIKLNNGYDSKQKE